MNKPDTTVSAALVAAQLEMRNVPKTATNPHFKNKYAPLDAIIAMCRPILNKHGFALIQSVVDGDILETTLHHISGEKVQLGRMALKLDKPNMQGFGSAITYAQRYSLRALGITTDDDDDGNAASAAAPAEVARPFVRITPKSLSRVEELIALTGTDGDRFLAYAKVSALADLSETDVPRLVKLLEKKIPA
jgi:hypothetical protein